ncbi:MAG: hypothetical protein LBJ75_04595 [Puniceicoccales bacterium]|jgi:hypothetical protein|nr:hypothetical protein [Puniceicoccales bacterium]
MEKLKRTQSVQSNSPLVSRPVEKQAGATKVGDFTAVAATKVSIPQRKVPGGALGARSVAAVADSQDSTVAPPGYWLECTAENTANLTEDEVVNLFCFKSQGNANAIRFGAMFFLPDEDQIAAQLVRIMSGDCLLEVFGGSLAAAKDFMYILFEEEFSTKVSTYLLWRNEYCAENVAEPLTLTKVNYIIRSAGEPHPQGLSPDKLMEQADIVGQRMLDTFGNKNQREEFESRLRRVVDLIVRKLPPPNAENQARWDNIRTAAETMISASQKANGDGERKLRRARARLPFLNL